MGKSRGKIKICVACSPGGHMVQARQLASVYEKYEHFYFTFSGGVAEGMKGVARVRTIPDVTRLNPFSWFTGFVLSFLVAAQERPDIVISTGAGVTVFFCIFAKLFGAKLIFLESMAKRVRPTWTARILYPFADLFLVQWPELTRFFPRARFMGRLF
jgi:UDP-N-acetylglucosamine:LPS N-acetylglucosamine transferase